MAVIFSWRYDVSAPKETQEGYQAGIEILEEALVNDPTSALAYAAPGDVDKTLYWLEQARERQMPWAFGFFSYFTAIRSLLEDPRIRAEAKLFPAPLVPYPKG